MRRHASEPPATDASLPAAHPATRLSLPPQVGLEFASHHRGQEVQPEDVGHADQEDEGIREIEHRFELDGNPATRVVLGDWYQGDTMLRWDNQGYRLGRLAELTGTSDQQGNSSDGL